MRKHLMKIQKTKRHFDIIVFKDYYDQVCSLQKSSLVKPCIWLGVDVNLDGKKVNNRMHLTIPQVKRLIPHLQAFIDTEEITLDKFNK